MDRAPRDGQDCHREAAADASPGRSAGAAPDSGRVRSLRRGSAAEPGRRRRIPPKLYRVGEVAEYARVSRQTVHNYTTMGLLRESRWTPGGHRLYGEEVFGRLDEVAAMRAENMSMQDIRDYFSRLEAEGEWPDQKNSSKKR